MESGMSKYSKHIFPKGLIALRESTGCGENFKVDRRRCKLLNGCEDVKKNSDGVVYWMQRDCRVQDNWALLFAQRMAHKAHLPLHVIFFGYPTKDLYPTMRQYKFLITGLEELAEELNDLNIKFHLTNTLPTTLPELIANNNLGALICDFNPLRCHRKAVEAITSELPKDVPFVQVDAHNIVPYNEASDKKEYAARTIRPKITKLLPNYLIEFPAVKTHQFKPKKLKLTTEDFDEIVRNNIKEFNDPIMPDITWAEPGYNGAVENLRVFLDERIKLYEGTRNEPCKNAQSDLSPWLHFGQISAQRCALEVHRCKSNKSTKAFLEELVIRRELTDNFCYYNENYDKLEGADNWAQVTLNNHREDKRERTYSQEEFAEAKTHDVFWNAAQMQLVREGKMHGYMRMYWCKKILEWTNAPEEAIRVALYLNDTYSLDGSDPNGFVGVMWSICGVHDHSWKEREVFGKVRFMVDYSLEKKFDMRTYCCKYLKNVPLRHSKRRKLR